MTAPMAVIQLQDNELCVQQTEDFSHGLIVHLAHHHCIGQVMIEKSRLELIGKPGRCRGQAAQPAIAKLRVQIKIPHAQTSSQIGKFVIEIMMHPVLFVFRQDMRHDKAVGFFLRDLAAFHDNPRHIPYRKQLWRQSRKIDPFQRQLTMGSVKGLQEVTINADQPIDIFFWVCVFLFDRKAVVISQFQINLPECKNHAFGFWQCL